jgi:cell division protein FtsI (penicillin-binding protein 3)
VALLVVLLVGFSAIVGRLVQLQVADASTYLGLARDQRIRPIDLPATRGSILDRNGHDLALSVPARLVFADPGILDDAERAASIVASTLGLDEGAVLDKIRSAPSGSRYVPLAHGVVPSRAAELQGRLDDAGVTGIAFLSESARYYPGGDLASQVIGFAGPDGHGLEGLEYQYDALLAGKAGHAIVERDQDGNVIPQGDNQTIPPVPGQDLVLSLDMNLQYEVQNVLAQAVQENEAKGGSIVVLDPHTGDVLAMANAPSFDANHYADAPAADRINRAIVDAYEPGSVNKVITAAAAVESGDINLNETFTVPWYLQVSDRLYHDAEIHDPETMTLADIVAYSSNIGTIKVAERLGAYQIGSYLGRFGFGSKVGVGFPGETNGILIPTGSWSESSLPSISIGQGVAVSPLQMAAVYATIANGGVYVRPRLVLGTSNADGVFHRADPSPTRRVVSEQTAKTVADMLAYGVDVGTGTAAQIPGYWVAGKTGTAQKPKPDGTGYYDDRFWASFMGFAPATDPAVVVAVVLDEPVSKFGGIASAPAFQDVARFALALLRVPQAAKPPTPPHAVPVG